VNLRRRCLVKIGPVEIIISRTSGTPSRAKTLVDHSVSLRWQVYRGRKNVGVDLLPRHGVLHLRCF
jgi:hypothetical protein